MLKELPQAMKTHKQSMLHTCYHCKVSLSNPKMKRQILKYVTTDSLNEPMCGSTAGLIWESFSC